MLKKVLFLLACSGGTAVAQISIGSSDMAVVGDELLTSSAVLASFDEALTGPSYTWDYSTLVPTGSGGDTVVSVGSTPLLYQFFFNNVILYPDHKADHALPGPGFDFQTLSVTDQYDYYKVDNAGFENVGFGANINGIPSSVQRIPVDEIYAFPLDYQNTSSSFSSFELVVPTLLYFQQDQTRNNEVDGWGTLILPSGSFDVLRVKSTIDRIDTVFIDAVGFGVTLPEPQTIEYKWLAMGEPDPLLQVITTAGAVTSVEYKYDPSTGIDDARRSGEFSLYPNPASGAFQLDTHDQVLRTYALFNAEGRLVETRSESGSFWWDTKALTPGLYLLKSLDSVKRVEIID